LNAAILRFFQLQRLKVDPININSLKTKQPALCWLFCWLLKHQKN